MTIKTCKEKEYWDVKCVDQFSRYWGKHLTLPETTQLEELREKLFNPATEETEYLSIYRESIEVLHEVFCRQHPECDCDFRQPTVKELKEGIGFFGVSVLKDIPPKKPSFNPYRGLYKRALLDLNAKKGYGIKKQE